MQEHCEEENSHYEKIVEVNTVMQEKIIQAESNGHVGEETILANLSTLAAKAEEITVNSFSAYEEEEKTETFAQVKEETILIESNTFLEEETIEVSAGTMAAAESVEVGSGTLLAGGLGAVGGIVADIGAGAGGGLAYEGEDSEKGKVRGSGVGGVLGGMGGSVRASAGSSYSSAQLAATEIAIIEARERRRRRRRCLLLIVPVLLFLLLICCLLPIILGPTAMVTITIKKQDVQATYLVYAVTGNLDISKHAVH